MTTIKHGMASYVARLRTLFRALDIKPSPAAKKMGLSTGFMSEIMQEKTGISGKLLLGIASTYPDVNINWLLTGKGEMFLPSDDQECLEMEIEYWQANHHLIKAALKIAYQRVVDSFGEERAEKIFKEVVTSLKAELMFPYPAGKIDGAGAKAVDEKKRKKS